MEKRNKNIPTEGNTEKKPLLVFAHRGEAQAFIKQLKFRPMDFLFSGLYENEAAFLLIAGEGLQTVSERLSAVAAVLHQGISHLINLGIAGGFSQKLVKDNIYSIRSVYTSQNGQVKFKSFTTANSNGEVDCISADQRILTSDDAEALSPFADVVDREAWGCASVAATLRLPFFCYKLISDLPGSGDVCLDIREAAAGFSEKLLDYYQSLEAPYEIEKSIPIIELPENFYATTAQKRQLASVLRHLSLKLQLPEADVLAKVDLQKIAAETENPKKRTTLLLTALNDLLNPFNAVLREKLQVFCEPLEKANWQVKFSQNYETDEVELSAKISHPRHLEKLQKALDEFDYAAVLRILNGEFDRV